MDGRVLGSRGSVGGLGAGACRAVRSRERTGMATVPFMSNHQLALRAVEALHTFSCTGFWLGSVLASFAAGGPELERSQ
jgi:cephalosporin-C deacetylase-like acetyl esterase